MTTHDISRHVLQPAKQYSGARMQKGRVILDSDFNEGELLDDEGQRVVVVDVVGRHGSSDRGFAIKYVKKDTYELEIAAGSYYLGGLRHEIADIADPTLGQLFSAQSDWRQSNRTGEEPVAPTPPLAARHDLAYLVGWEQTVSAREDGELLEPSLGGRDTSVRVRRMHRVYVKDSTSLADCAGAFGALVTGLTTGGHIYDTTSGELLSAGRLQVSFDAAANPEDLCSGSANGYKGAENQAIRVEQIASDRFLWALDNAAPLHRITASVNAGVVTIQFLTPPQEQAQFPLKGQVLEILPWGAQLPTGEHTADFRIADNIGGGVFARVTQSYNPRTKVLVASTIDSAKLGHMITWFNTMQVAEANRHFYLRVWNSDNPALTTDPYGLEFTTTTPVPLAGTGLKVQFMTPGIVGDHWIIAARPTTPEVVVPWELSKAPAGAAPHGPRRFYAPLAIVHWEPIVGGAMKVTVDSCRRTFRGLTRLGGCCSVTVGDGATSHGDYTSIEKAILALPPGEPGKVCVLPGVYEQTVHIMGRKNVVVEGCGSRTILRTPPGNDKSKALITLEGCQDFTLRKLRIEASGQFGVGVTTTNGASVTFSERITLEDLEVITARDRTLPPAQVSALAITDEATPFPLCTVGAIGVYDLKVLRCKLLMVGDLSAAANVLLFACVRAVVRDCKILTPPGDGRTSKAWGGLQIAGYCNDILVEACEIAEGLGYGVTLGSVRPALTLGASTSLTPSSNAGGITEGVDCPGLGGGFPLTSADSGEPVQLVPDPGPHDVRLRNNRIRGMGSSGISVLGFFPEEEGEPVQQIETHRLVIADNIIENNYTHPSEQPPSEALRAVVAFGGIVLADADSLRIHDNRIEGNGADHRRPVCGIYVLHGEDVVVENNRIRRNGPRVASSGISGHRAGIALQLVGRRISVDSDGSTGGTAGGSLLTVEPETAQPAARVRGNVVLQPAGRALQIYGIGPMFVEGNVLVSEGLSGLSFGERRFAAHCVEIQNVGQSRELTGIIPANIHIFGEPELLADPLPTNIQLHDGRILFTNNQVRFNPVVGAGINVFCATRIQSYGEVAVLGNQFYARLAPGEGILLHDTVLTAWSLRASHNRWEDPINELSRGLFATTISAQTLAFMNITTLNQASRCIHVDVPFGHGISNNPIAANLILVDSFCNPNPALNELLSPSPLVAVP